MDFIFDDEVDEVGSDVEAYCPKCKADTAHVVMSKYEDEIRRVQCNVCGDVHAFRKPRGETEDDIPEPIAAKKRAAKAKPTWDQVMAKAKKEPKLYMVADRYSENDLISHPKFGVGFVSEVIDLDKIEVTFQAERRVLVHNRKGMSLPPAAYAHAVDATLPNRGKGKGGKGKDGEAQHVQFGHGALSGKSGKVEAKAPARVVPAAAPVKTAAKPARPGAKPAKEEAKPAKAGAKPAKAEAAAKPAAKPAREATKPKAAAKAPSKSPGKSKPAKPAKPKASAAPAKRPAAKPAKPAAKPRVAAKSARKR